MSLGVIVKVAQIGFYTVASLIAILTFFAAKKTLLSPVNTEYQKRVIQRLSEVSDLILAEFDPESPEYWANKDPTKEIVGSVNEVFLANKDEILKTGKFITPIPCSKDERHLVRLVETLKTDPFIPKSIRDTVADLLENRADVISEVQTAAVENYTKALAKGKYLDSLDTNCHWVHNQVNSELYKRGCGISQINDEVHKLRLTIQSYLESFDPR